MAKKTKTYEDSWEKERFASGANCAVYKHKSNNKLLFFAEGMGNASIATYAMEPTQAPKPSNSDHEMQQAVYKRLQSQKSGIRYAQHEFYEGKQTEEILGTERYAELTNKIKEFQKLIKSGDSDSKYTTNPEGFLTCIVQQDLSTTHHMLLMNEGPKKFKTCHIEKPIVTAVDALDQMQKIHDIGIAHGDIKGNNMAINKHDGTLTFIDWGDPIGSKLLQTDNKNKQAFESAKKTDSQRMAWTLLEMVFQRKIASQYNDKEITIIGQKGQTIHSIGNPEDRLMISQVNNGEGFKKLVQNTQLLRPTDTNEIAATKAFIIAVHEGKHPYQIYQDMKKTHGTSNITETLEKISTVKEEEEARKYINNCRMKGLDEFVTLSKIAKNHPQYCKTQIVQNTVKRCKAINVLLVFVSILLPPLAPGIAILIVDNARRIKQAENAQSKTVDNAEPALNDTKGNLEKTLLETGQKSRPEAVKSGRESAPHNLNNNISNEENDLKNNGGLQL